MSSVQYTPDDHPQEPSAIPAAVAEVIARLQAENTALQEALAAEQLRTTKGHPFTSAFASRARLVHPSASSGQFAHGFR